MIKQVIVIRKDLNMRKGKMVAQGAHASLAAILAKGELKTDADTKEWLAGAFTKIVVSVDSEESLINIYRMAQLAGLNCALITDAGRTEFDGVPTKTAVAIGPGKAEEIDSITGDLKLL
ncbi:MAG: aminoacyl-tRNA hydrolase [Candidatus Peribacteraceae bacterium]|nr:aminoacyl-tRNA hydrolase [Candidatus Peribacteraceae bacterium]